MYGDLEECKIECDDPNFPFVSDRDGTIPSLSREHGVPLTPRPNCEMSRRTRTIVELLCALVGIGL